MLFLCFFRLCLPRCQLCVSSPSAELLSQEIDDVPRPLGEQSNETLFLRNDIP